MEVTDDLAAQLLSRITKHEERTKDQAVALGRLSRDVRTHLRGLGDGALDCPAPARLSERAWCAFGML